MHTGVLALFFAALIQAGSCRAEILALEAFLEQVKASNAGYRALEEESTGALGSSKAAELIFRPRLFVNAQYLYDPRETHSSALEGDRHIGRTASVGVQEQTPWGLQFQLALDYNQDALLGTASPLINRPTTTNLNPVPSFNLSLLQNRLGKADRENQRLMVAEARARAEGKRFAARAALVDAEGRYWKLAVLREAIRLQRGSLERARRILALETDKQKKRLSDLSDVLLGQAAVNGRELELRSYLAEARTAARALNSARGLDTERVDEELSLPEPEDLLDREIPHAVQLRGDLRSAEQQAIAARAGYEVAREKLLPELSLFGSIYALGLKLTLPLDQSTVAEARSGYARQAEASEAEYSRKRFESRSEWNDLVERCRDLQERLQLALQLERVQKRKFEEIQRRRREGLSVAFQVFQYELEYLDAAQARRDLQGQLLGVISQLKLYGERS